MKRVFFWSFFLLAASSILSQPELKVIPDMMVFEDPFHRIENVKLINEGNSNLIIDSLSYQNNWYFVRFSEGYDYPLIISPGDTVEMDCIMASYYQVHSYDTLNIMSFHSNSVGGMNNVPIKIGYFNDVFTNGTITGQVTSNGIPVANARVRFIYNGTYIIKWVDTDINGNYSVSVPPGDYQIAAEKDSFYTTFYDKKYGPFNANFVNLPGGDDRIINLNLTPVINSGFSICGKVHDDVSKNNLSKAIAVVRRGRFNPSKINANNAADFSAEIYTAFVNYDGSFSVKNIQEPGYYYLQFFSDYFTPTYYSAYQHASFWQQADSVWIGGEVDCKDIYMARDSSTGGGTISGEIIAASGADFYKDVIVYAKSVIYNQIYNFSFVNDQGEFKIINLPYGEYELIAQKLGYDDVRSNGIEISPDLVEVKDINLNYNIIASVKDKNLPEKLTLYQNYPNPFNPSTRIELYLPEGNFTKLKIYNMLGEEVAGLYEGFLTAGNHQFIFDGSGLSSGSYIVQVHSGTSLKSQKIVLMK